MKILHCSKGFTLIELLIAIVMSAIISFSIYDFYLSNQKSKLSQDAKTVLQQNSRATANELMKDIRLAGSDIDIDNNQPNFVYYSPFEMVFNADMDSTRAAIDPALAHAEVPPNPASGVAPYDPTMAYTTGAETIRWTIDSNNDGLLDNKDKISYTDSNHNPSTFTLYRQLFGSNGTNNGGELEVAGEDLRGPDTYPDGTYPQPLFSVWISEDRNNTGNIEADEGEVDVNGNTKADEYLWGDDGSGGATANNGVLEQGELAALYTGNNGKAKFLNTYNVEVTNTNGDTRLVGRASKFYLKTELANITRVELNVNYESGIADEDYKSSPHSTSSEYYKYRDVGVSTIVAPRNPIPEVTSYPTLILSASPISLQCPQNTSTITATFMDAQSNAIGGVEVEFVASMGSFSSSSQVSTIRAATDSSGTASIPFYIRGTGISSATVSGAAVISGSTYRGVATISIRSGPPSSINLVALPLNIAADGSSTSTITALVSDSCGNLVNDGTGVSFSVTSPSATLGLMNPASVSTVNGQAVSYLTAGIITETATVTVTSGPASATINVGFSSCTLEITPTYNAIQGDGISSTPVTMLLKDLSNNLISNATVSLTIDEGSLNPASVITDGSGGATFTVTSSAFPHTATIIGTVGAGSICVNTMGSAQVSFTGCNVQLTSDKDAIATNDSANVTVKVIDPSTGLPSIGIPVTFSMDNSLGNLSITTGNTNGSGELVTVFTALADPGNTQIRADVVCGSGTINIPIKKCDGALSANPSMIIPGGTSTSTVTLTIIDTVTGLPMANESVSFSTDFGSIDGSSTVTTDASGQASITLRSGLNPVVATVTATTLCGTFTLEVPFSSWSMVLSINPTSISANDTSVLTAKIYNNGVEAAPPAGSSVALKFIDAGSGLGSSFSVNPVFPVGAVATASVNASSVTGIITVQAEITVSGTLITANTVDITISSTGGVLMYDPASANVCGSKNDKVAFRMSNGHGLDVSIESMKITWDKAGTEIEKVKTGGSLSGCSGGNDAWKDDKCPGGPSPSPATLTFASCSNPIPASINIPAGQFITFNELKFDEGSAPDEDMRGVNFTIEFFYKLVGDITLYTSTITFSTP